ncbi:probable inactive leucine-rich repeat receptor-like protein kinase At3g03770 isoform X1 [Miscanthus floridulus]|uniref:probable inactive leucine-rich repeat receptor-like protein kinase At3g03770 isoform X1 n=1 Tax=Miscanthus floridulus TaxID=154761 RepID=UPI00345A95EB
MAWHLSIIVMVTTCLILFSIGEQSSQSELLQQLRKQLEYPRQLDAWGSPSSDPCYTKPTAVLAVTCEGNAIRELKIIGDRITKPPKFSGFSVPNVTLSEAFVLDSFVTTLTRLTTLRVVILVSLGLWGPLPDKIHRLSSLEVLDLSSNFLYGSIPPKLSVMSKLHTMTLDGNYFNESVPDWLDLFSNLTVLRLQSNQLKGSIPASIGKAAMLTELALAGNSISGDVPNLGSLNKLEMLDLRDNELDGELPEMPTSVVTILLSKNSLKGEIPEQFGQLNRLQHLDVSFNFLVGSPPAELFALPNISYLNLAANMLSGSLLSSLTCSSTLGFVDLSTNRLTGDLPSCLNGNLNNKVVKFDGNCFSVDPAHQHEAKYCQQSHKGRGSNKDVGLVVTVVGILFIMLVLSLLLMASNKRSCHKVLAEQQFQQKHTQDNSISGMSFEPLVNARCISQAVKLGTQMQPSHRIFSLEELKEATKCFERSAFLGEGAIGKLYKGKLENGTLIAIRCLALHQRYSIRNLKLRLDLLAKLRHPNLVCLLGHCIDSAVDESTVKRVFLVYEYVPGGTLSSYLSASSPEKTLKWCDRLQVLIAIAKAVHFLHTGIIPGSLSNRLKSSSILVDEHHMAKLSDYGLSIITEEIYKHEVIGQKKKYLQNDPAEMENLEDDVCSFGFILLEVLMGPKLHEKGGPFILKDLVVSMSTLEERDQVVDPVIIGTSSQDSLSIVVSIMIKCLSIECSARPSIEEVLWNLQYAAQVQTMADSDQRSEVSSQAS